MQSLVKRRLSTGTHYDSQSGKHFQLSDTVHLHVLEPTSSMAPPLTDTMKTFLRQQHANLNIISVAAADKQSQQDGIQKVTEIGSCFDTRCYITDAFSVDLYTLQAVAANMCDGGCQRVILTDSADVMGALDEYDLVEAIEAVFWNDVVGEPMSMRVGLRATGGDSWRQHVAAALELNMKHFDVSLNGDNAPKLDSMLPILGEFSLQHNIKGSLE